MPGAENEGGEGRGRGPVARLQSGGRRRGQVVGARRGGWKHWYSGRPARFGSRSPLGRSQAPLRHINISLLALLVKELLC